MQTCRIPATAHRQAFISDQPHLLQVDTIIALTTVCKQSYSFDKGLFSQSVFARVSVWTDTQIHGFAQTNFCKPKAGGRFLV